MSQMEVAIGTKEQRGTGLLGRDSGHLHRAGALSNGRAEAWTGGLEPGGPQLLSCGRRIHSEANGKQSEISEQSQSMWEVVC